MFTASVSFLNKQDISVIFSVQWFADKMVINSLSVSQTYRTFHIIINFTWQFNCHRNCFNSFSFPMIYLAIQQLCRCKMLCFPEEIISMLQLPESVISVRYE